MVTQVVTINPTPPRYMAKVANSSQVTEATTTDPSGVNEVTTTVGFTFAADVTFEEAATDEMSITQHPVEYGAQISDHAFRNPARLTLRVGWSNSSAEAAGDPNYVNTIYQKMLAIQAKRTPFATQTGKRLYPSMLFRSLQQTTDERTETTLMVTAELQEVIVVNTTTTTIADASLHANPQKTAPVSNAGVKQALPAATPTNAKAT